ncbi:MAG: class I SAM-dependent methyltransferase, partial [Thermoanaerobaculia bacterium]
MTRHTLCWDAGTGSGQAAGGLAEHFAEVVATDASADQIAHATPNARVTYIVAPAESSGLPDRWADLVTAGQAVHWFDQKRFFDEVRRVVAPGGAVAVWAY